MRSSFLLVVLAIDGVIANSWFSKAAYNKWHETELERWLSDHNVPYPTPADRKDLLDLVKNSWEENVARPYNSWDTNQMQRYLSAKGVQVQKSAESNKNSLVEQIKASWSETTDQASDAYGNVKDWIFDSWTDSQLKTFLDHHKIPNPSPRDRDSLLYRVRSNYAALADKLNEAAAYPGNWIYDSWSDSDLKAYLDERGIPVPQPSKRDKLIASVRRNARVAGQAASSATASLAASASSAQASLTDELINSWTESQLKAWCDKNGIKVPQGSRVNELRALVRKKRAQLLGDNVSYSASSVYGAATTKAGNAFAEATNNLYDQGKQWYDWAAVQIGMGSEDVKSSVSSMSSAVSSYASSVGSVAEKSASAASKSALKASGDAVAAANSARTAVSKSAASVSRAASVSAKAASVSAASASARIKNEL